MADPSGVGLTGEFLRKEAAEAAAPNRAQLVIGRVLRGEEVPDEEIFEALNEQDSLIVGSKETCRRTLRAYAEIRVDRMADEA